jgi:hypothetical protein
MIALIGAGSSNGSAANGNTGTGSSTGHGSSGALHRRAHDRSPGQPEHG